MESKKSKLSKEKLAANAKEIGKKMQAAGKLIEKNPKLGALIVLAVFNEDGGIVQGSNIFTAHNIQRKDLLVSLASAVSLSLVDEPENVLREFAHLFNASCPAGMHLLVL